MAFDTGKRVSVVFRRLVNPAVASKTVHSCYDTSIGTTPSQQRSMVSLHLYTVHCHFGRNN